MTDRTPAEIAEALEAQDGYTLFCQWADAIDPDKHAQAWEELSSWDRGEWHRRALPFTQLGNAAAARIREMELALKPFSRVYSINEPISEDWPDDKAARDVMAGRWPTWADLRAARSALARGED